MKEDRFKKIYELAQELQIKCYKEEYEKLNDNVGTFEDFVNSEILKINNKDNKENKINNCILNDTIKKDNLVINTYLIHFKHIDPVLLDENYKVLPLKEKELYQSGAIITMKITDGYIKINDLFSNCENEEEKAKDEYVKLKNYLVEITEDDLLNEVEKNIIKELNS